MGVVEILAAVCLLLLVSGVDPAANVQTDPGDAAVMRALAKSLDAYSSTKLGWSDAGDPCMWKGVTCESGRVIAIQIGNCSLAGTLPAGDDVALRNLAFLTRLELMSNRISGVLPSLFGLGKLTVLLLHTNNFSAFPPGDYFAGLTSLVNVSIGNNPLPKWQIPSSLADASRLFSFNANNVSLTGIIPDFFGTAFPSLYLLNLAGNSLTGGIPTSFAKAVSVVVLWLTHNDLGGSIDVISDMVSLQKLFLNMNNFSGPLPDFSRLTNLEVAHLRDNHFTGPVPSSLTSLMSLNEVYLTNNLLQGPFPVFRKPPKIVDMNAGSERFCLPEPGECNAIANVLLSIAASLGYPSILANNWKGNDPCSGWSGITCNNWKNVSVVNLSNMDLKGTISPDFRLLPSLQKLVLSNNNLTGVIPPELQELGSLQFFDVSNNSLWGKVPTFSANVIVHTEGNPDIGKDGPPSPEGQGGGSGSSSSVAIIVGVVVAAIFVALLIGFFVFYYRRIKRNGHRAGKSNPAAWHTSYCGSDGEWDKVFVPSYGFNSEDNNSSRDANGIPVIEGGKLNMPIEVLRRATNNFSDESILGRGGFGTVYKGVLNNGTKVAVKRMTGGLGDAESKGLTEFQAEITVLTRVRHKHLVSLLGYCLEGNEKILIYEYMPQGTLSDHLFISSKERIKPLEWKSRLRIALDVARAVEYLHTLAHGTFIHRDLKPSNILLGDDMRAKVADFGLVRLAPDGISSVQTRLAGTFGYPAPEYATTGRVTTRIDIYSFGVILMELISGRKALDNSQPEESIHLVTWFRRSQINGTFTEIIDPLLDLNDETTMSINKVAELAAQCCARNAHERPAINHVVNVLSSIAEFWQPNNSNLDDGYEMDLSMTLPEALGRWQASEDSNRGDDITASSFDNSTTTSTPGALATRDLR